MDVVVKVEGLAETERKLRMLPMRIGKNAMRRALRKGANTIRDAARSNFMSLDDAPTPEKIFKNVVVKGASARRSKEAGGVVMRVGVLGGSRNMTAYGEFGGKGKGNPGGDTWYWRLLEFGTSKFAAKSPMRKAMASAAEKALNTTAMAMDSEFDKELAKLG